MIDKANSDLSTCEPNTKKVQVNFDVPRDPAEYRPSVHFGQRLRERVPAELRDRVVEAAITCGELSGNRPPSAADEDGDVKQYFAFEIDVDGRRWKLVVGIRPQAFIEPDAKHIAVTIMEVDG